jgi:hypothetical protein
LEVEVEVLPPDRDQDRREEPTVRLTHVRALGVVGTLLALLTMGAAVGVGLVAFFGTTLLSAGLVWLVWPVLFTPAFSEWVFGAPHPVFWKLFLLFLVVGTVAKLLGVRRK